MATWKFKLNMADGILDCKVRYRAKTPLESLGAMALNDYTRDYDDTVDVDAKCIKSLENHKYWDKSTNSFQTTFTKEAGS